MLQLSLATLTTLTLSLVTPHAFHPCRCCCCCCQQLVTMPLCEHPWSGLLAPGHGCDISSVVVSRYTRLDSFVVKHISLSLRTTNFGGRFRITLLLVCIYPLTRRPHQITHSTPSFSTPAFSAPPASCARPC